MEQGNHQLLDGIVMEQLAYDDTNPLALPQLPIFLLTEDTHKIESSNQILKYQPIPSFLHQIKQGINERNEKYDLATATARTQLIGIGSSVARSGKTVFAVHLCAAIGAKNSRVFYLNLEMWNSSEVLLQHKPLPESVKSYSDFLYLIKTQPDDARQWLAKHTYYDESLRFERLLPFQHSADRVQLLKEDAVLLLDIIKKSNRFDYIVLDLNEGMTEWNLTLLEKVDIYYQVNIADKGWLAKHMQIMQYSESTYGEFYKQVNTRTISVTRETNNKHALSATGTEEHRGIRLPYIEQWEHGKAYILEVAEYRAAIEKCAALLTKYEVVSS